MKKIMFLALPIALFMSGVASLGSAQETEPDRPATQQPRQDGRRSPRGRQSNRNRQSRKDDAPKVGSPAPDFKLKSLDGKSETQLSKFKGKKPVVLFFGSYT